MNWGYFTQIQDPEADPHAKHKPTMDVEQMPGCCSLLVLSNFHSKASLAQLKAAEKFARKDDQSCMIATISENQKVHYQSDKLLEAAGWTLAHQFRSKPYGGGTVYVYVKNLKPLRGEDVAYDREEREAYLTKIEREAAKKKADNQQVQEMLLA